MWIKKENATYQIISANIHEDSDKYQVWVERPTGKSLKIFESKENQLAHEVKDAIDFALKSSIPVLEL